MSIFQTMKANIIGNPSLYPAQIKAYEAALAHYEEFPDYEHRESLIVMPTGSGKTGVMSILPFGLSKGKVLIITPGTIIRETIFQHFNSTQNPEQTFWIKRNILIEQQRLPNSYLYIGFNSENKGEKSLTLSKLNGAEIIITNVHKIGSSKDEVNLMNLLEPDFFDMIIIDEAHHVAATMWQEALEHFKATKVIKLTATPFRGDKQTITTHSYDPIYEYTLGEAIKDGLLKNIVKYEDIPGEVTFFDRNTNKKYSLEKAKAQLGNDFVSRSIAMSESCSKEVIKRTKEAFDTKRTSYPHHQILAVTCNDEHAQDVCRWFNELGFKASYVSTASVSKKDIEQRLNDFANGIYDVMVSIQLLGEGYDNPNISIVSLFRPFKTLGPYAQAIGRGLRKIYSENKLNPIDNFCNVIYHQELNLEELWKYYKEQETFGDIIRQQHREISEQLSFDFDELGYVEKKSTGEKTEVDEDRTPISAVQKLNVSTYSSKGVGKEDSFTANGIEEYKKAQQQIIEMKQQELKQFKEKMDDLVTTGALSEEDAQILIKSRELEAQNKVNKNYEEFHDIVMAETLRQDYINWLNLKVEDFFKTSNLTKKGYDLNKNEENLGVDKINNIGYIIKNINQTLFRETRKHISTYNAIDFAKAKERSLKKFEFWLKRYGKKEEL
ncbi:DEAD/DEAH box helicase [Bacillus chungangensis]|uniref:Superfamily II DNA or RNA helicase n=1 Tax=Bacillus chungangensis TaxID=587633 RepID=A0ABT9WT82_9BACI|nr:DEAD/DEAH box helicase family protein [Bacillus chungangensis]MDQ0176497.1 superfamily II DNA or RNA helicase [Bacillus chungangensis]